MSLFRSSCAGVLALALWPAGAGAGPVPLDGDPILYWVETLSNSQSGSPVPGSRTLAMTSVALYDVVVATLGDPSNSYLGVTTPGGNTRAAAAVAAHDLLSVLFPSKASDYAAQRDAQLALVPDGAAKTNGMTTGAAIAAAMINARSNDGSTAVVNYMPTGQPGDWAPTPPANAAFAFAQWGDVTPWLLQAGDQFRPEAPPELTSDEYTAAFDDVKALGVKTGSTRTDEQTKAAQFWATNTGNPIFRLGVELAKDKGLSTMENARLFALLSTAIADAAVATWDAKLAYEFWRPITAIHQADDDDNPATIADPLWEPLIVNPPYPGYTSGLTGLMGSGALVLETTFGNSFGFCMAHPTNPALDSCWANFDELLLEVTYNRVWAGIHFNFDQTGAFTLAENIVAYAFASQQFETVPEPAMLGLLGLGALVLMARRRRSSTRIS